MKKSIIIIAVSLLTILSACKKGTSNGPGNNSNLNSTETQLLGTWYLQKEVDSDIVGGVYFFGTDTTLTGYSTSFYITFTSTVFGSTSAGAGINWLQYQGSWEPSVAAIPNSTTGTAITDYWYYDNTVDKLDIVAWQCTILSISSTQLVVYYNSGAGSITSYFTK